MFICPSKKQRQSILENVSPPETGFLKRWEGFYRRGGKACISPYLHLHTRGTKVLLFQTLTLKKIMGGPELRSFCEHLMSCDRFDYGYARQQASLNRLPDDALAEFMEKQFLHQPGAGDPCSRLCAAHAPVGRAQSFAILFLSLQGQDTSFCQYSYEMPPAADRKMDNSTLQRALDLFTGEVSGRGQHLIFALSTGRAPIEARQLNDYLDVLRSVQAQKKPGSGHFRNVLIAETSQIDHGFVRAIEPTGLEVALCDGRAEGTSPEKAWEEYVRSYSLLAERMHAVIPVITTGNYGGETIFEFLEYFLSRCEVKFLRLQLSPGMPGARGHLGPGELAALFMSLFKWLRGKGVKENGLGRTVWSLVNESRGTGGFGPVQGRLSIGADGSVGICPQMLSTGRGILGNLSDRGLAEKILSHPDAGCLPDIPLHVEECRSCIALGLCRGGCPLGSSLQQGDDTARNLYHCRFMQELTTLLLDEILLQQREEAR